MGRQGLDFPQHGAHAVEDGGDGRAGLVGRPFRQKELRRIFQFGQAAARHGEQARLIGRAKAVLNAPKDTELIIAFPFKIEDDVDHVLHHPRSGNGSVFRDVADDDDRNGFTFGKGHEAARPFSNLG